MVERLLVPGLKMLLNTVFDSGTDLIVEIGSIMAYQIFGDKNLDTVNGQFLMLMSDSLFEFCEYLNKRIDRENPCKFEYDSNAYTQIKLVTLSSSTSDVLLKSILREMLGDPSYKLLNEQDIKQWIGIVDKRLPQERYKTLYRYLLIHKEKHNQLSVDTVLKFVQTLNMIEGEETIEDVLYNWFFEQCSKIDNNFINKDILEVGYILADYLEKKNNYDRAVEIAKQLLKVYDKEIDTYDKECIHKFIGCAYSFAIARVQPEGKKLQCLEHSEILFQKAYILCENFANIRENRYEDKEFLWALYYSDYGAMLVNKGDYCKSKQDDTGAGVFYENAEKAHKMSLEHKRSLRKAINGNRLYDENQIDNMIARSISNLGGVFFRMEKYKDSLKQQQEALKVFVNQGDRVREYRTKELIVGCYIALWDNNISILKKEDVDMCIQYMKTAKFYYEITNNRNIDIVVNKIATLEKIKTSHGY